MTQLINLQILCFAPSEVVGLWPHLDRPVFMVHVLYVKARHSTPPDMASNLPYFIRELEKNGKQISQNSDCHLFRKAPKIISGKIRKAPGRKTETLGWNEGATTGLPSHPAPFTSGLMSTLTVGEMTEKQRGETQHTGGPGGGCRGQEHSPASGGSGRRPWKEALQGRGRLHALSGLHFSLGISFLFPSLDQDCPLSPFVPEPRSFRVPLGAKPRARRGEGPGWSRCFPPTPHR